MAKHHGVRGEVLPEQCQQGAGATGRAREAGLAGGAAGFRSSSALCSNWLMLARLRRRNFIGVSRGLGVVLSEVGELQLIAEGLRSPVNAFVVVQGLCTGMA